MPATTETTESLSVVISDIATNGINEQREKELKEKLTTFIEQERGDTNKDKTTQQVEDAVNKIKIITLEIKQGSITPEQADQLTTKIAEQIKVSFPDINPVNLNKLQTAVQSETKVEQQKIIANEKAATAYEVPAAKTEPTKHDAAKVTEATILIHAKTVIEHLEFGNLHPDTTPGGQTQTKGKAQTSTARG